jgi:hypothetical protein
MLDGPSEQCSQYRVGTLYRSDISEFDHLRTLSMVASMIKKCS